MSIGSLGGIANSVAGAPLAQTKGSEVDRAQQDANVQQRHVQNEAKADAAAGIGETDGQEQSSADRDADGRRPWEQLGQPTPESNSDEPPAARSRDASGQSGTQLDLSG
jgi:hypothetical protein